MCEKFLKKSVQEHVEKLFVDESLSKKKSFLQLTKDLSDCLRDIPAPSTIKYPKANLYYASAEDIHPAKRIISASKFFDEQKFVSHFACKERFINQDSNLEDEAVNYYLRTEPPSFVIFGKPGLHRRNLASAIADIWNCVFISPVSLVQQEIDAGTEKGQYMERILRSGKSIKPNITMNLIRYRIKRRDVKHRGYVIECLPFIPSVDDMNFDSSSRPIVNMDDTCPEFCETTTSEENCEAYEDSITPNNIRYDTQYKYELEIRRQIDEMFLTWPRKPVIIIYLVCPKRDVMSRSEHWRIDLSTGDIIDTNEFARPLNDESDTSYDFSQVANESITDNRRLVNRTFGVEMQCELYERLALPVIDKWVLAHDPQFVIRVDGRSSTRRILQILKIRLCTLALQPSILPKRMIVQDDAHFLETPAKINSKRSTEEVFEVLRQREVVSPAFPWKLSAWKFYCPVALAQGRTMKGLSKHAVRFLNKIFFLSSEEAANLFIENPRTFLLPPNPRPACKIAIFGPKYAGKSQLGARLAEAFGGTVINVDGIMTKLIKQREESLNQKNDSNVQISLELIDKSVDEKADIIVQNIKEIPDLKLEDELRRDGGYVVDGMCVNVEIWRKIIDAGIVFEHIIVLFENEPYDYLLNKFRNFFYLDNSVRKIDYDIEAGQEEYRMLRENAEQDYLEHLTRFASEWIKFEKEILEFEGHLIICNLADIQDATEYVINHIKSRFNVSVNAREKDQENETQREETAAVEMETNLATANAEERGNVIDLETAEQLLSCGYFFFSAFGRWCPVQVYTNKIPVQMFLPMKARGRIFPVIRHPYIYFLAGEEALSLFLNDPSKYQTLDSRLSLIPLRISIIGPPKCGKTTLASRFAKTYGMKIITPLKAMRHMLKYYPWTESARKIEDELRAGRPASIESITRAIEMFSIGPRAATQGYILDDCPSSRQEAEQLALLGMQPMIIFDLKADFEFCLECLSWGNHVEAEESVNFSVDPLSQRYEKWQVGQASFRDWQKKFSQNVIELDATKSKWYVWTRADHAMRSRFADVILYFNEVDLEKVHSLKHMCVSPFEFRWRQSRYESYCPVCLRLEKLLKTSGRLVDSSGMVQFREHFYWICPQHIDAFVEDPLQYVSPANETSLLDERPRILEEVADAEHACWAQRLQVGGLCPVTYVDGLPDRKLMQGRADLGAIFKARRVPVPDARFDYLCEYFKPASKVPAFLHVMDIAGLVKGAAEGQGLGNNFLSHIGACDGIFHLCRVFEDDDVTHVEGDVNPVRDLDIISEELRLKDIEFLNTHLEKLEKLVIRGNDKKLKPEYETLLKVKGVLTDDKKHIRFADWSSNDVEVLNKYLFLTSKPILYLVNLSEKDYIRKKNKWLIKIKEWVDKNDPGAVLIPFSGIFENKILDMDEAERTKYFEEHKVTSALDKIIVQGYKALNLQYFFTAGHDEVKAWTIQKGTRAPQAAGKIHTDFEKGFIMAEVMKFEDFKNEGSEAAVKAAGKYRQQGRAYVVEDGDIIFFKFNAGAGLKDAKKK